jgi:hypothetical protein
MKFATIVLTALLFSVLFLAGCNDSESNLLTNTELAGIDDTHEVIVKTKEGDGPWVTQKLIPVLWDGKSKMEEGVAYRFNSEDEKIAALAMVPELKGAYEHALQQAAGRSLKGSDKTKEISSSALASAYASVELYEEGGAMECEAHTESDPLGTGDRNTHYHGLITTSYFRTVVGPTYSTYYMLSRDYMDCYCAADTYVSVRNRFYVELAWDAATDECY